MSENKSSGQNGKQASKVLFLADVKIGGRVRWGCSRIFQRDSMEIIKNIILFH